MNSVRVDASVPGLDDQARGVASVNCRKNWSVARAAVVTVAGSPWARHSTSSGPLVNPPLSQGGQDLGEIDPTGSGGDQHFLGREEIFDAHSGNETVHGGGVFDRIQGAVGVVEDISGIVPESEAGMANAFDDPPALGAGGVGAAVGFDAEADPLFPGVIAALGHDLVVGVEQRRIAGSTQHQVWAATDHAMIDQPSQPGDAGLDRDRHREVPAVDRKDLEVPGFGGVGNPGDLLRCGFDGDDHPAFALGGHEPGIVEPSLGDAVERDFIRVSVPGAGVAAELVSAGGSGGRQRRESRESGERRETVLEEGATIHDPACGIRRRGGKGQRAHGGEACLKGQAVARITQRPPGARDIQDRMDWIASRRRSCKCARAAEAFEGEMAGNNARGLSDHDARKESSMNRRASNDRRWITVTRIAGGLSLCTSLLVISLTGGELRWRHFTIADPLPGEGWGTAGIPLADLDGDGDLDVALSRREAHGFYWYERKSDSAWVQHVLSESPELPQSLGAAAVDVDRDGWIDLVFSQVWFRNPGTLRETPGAPWPVHRYEGGGHDILGADVDGDGRPEVVVFDGDRLVWFSGKDLGTAHPVAEGIGHHGGLTPNGAGDLDGDGDNDLVIAGMWFENPGNGMGNWTRRTWPYTPIPNASYGVSIRSWVVDLDADGQRDIVYSDCDTGSGHVHWVKNEDRGQRWSHQQLPDPPTRPGDPEGTGSWHSLGVADFDGDGDLDLFAGEQEDPDTYMTADGKLPMKPPGLKERGVIWLQSGTRPPAFTPHVIHVDNPGWHDASIGDVDGDGDIDIVSKIWNKDGPTYHADYWRNDTPRG